MRVGVWWGKFDVFHIGHLNSFEYCKQHCDYLVVGVASDDYCSREKSYGNKTVKGRQPLFDQESRQRIVDGLTIVDSTYIYEKSCPFDLATGLIKNGQPVSVVFLNGELEGTDTYNEALRYLEDWDIEYVYVPRTPNISSTYIKESGK